MSSLRQRPSLSTSAGVSPPPLPADAGVPPRSTLSQALESSAHLANLLPTGTVLAFQLLIPFFTNNGSCDSATRPMTALLLVVLAASCLLASFTDSVRSSDGRLHYGFVTPGGLWLFDQPAGAAPPDADLSKYGLTFIDVAHAALSLLVFGAVALRDKNVVSCFYPAPTREAQEVLDIVPVGVGFVCSLLFVVFPSRRHGIGYPVARDR